MNNDTITEYFRGIVNEVRKLSHETEWLEFKHNNDNPEKIGEYISALSNSAALCGKTKAYMIWGIDNSTNEIIGTDFDPFVKKVGNEELENWLHHFLDPNINFQFHKIPYNENNIVLMEISPAMTRPIAFKHIEYVRIGSYKKKLKDFPEKERELWRIFKQISFEQEIALANASAEDILKLLDYPAYFNLLDIPLPEGRTGILEALAADEMIVKKNNGNWDITNLGAVLFAKNLTNFRHLKRKSIRVIQYKGTSRIDTIREQEGVKGYACGFEGLIDFITNLLPTNEIIGKALRKEMPMFPELALRELVANAIIHQDFHIKGSSPMVEIFDDRMEITNPGLPLINTIRFIDSPPKSRNEALASFMRRVGICEERGSGIDKVVFQTEVFQLPAPLFETPNGFTKSTLFAHQDFNDMDKSVRIRACYQHACLQYVTNKKMTNKSLRERFGVSPDRASVITRTINWTIDANLISKANQSESHKNSSYLPFWAVTDGGDIR